MKQNCGVRPGLGDGCDMVEGGLGDSEGGAIFQKYFARTEILLCCRKKPYSVAGAV